MKKLLLLLGFVVFGCKKEIQPNYAQMDFDRNRAFRRLMNQDICGSYSVGFALTEEQSNAFSKAVEERCK